MGLGADFLVEYDKLDSQKSNRLKGTGTCAVKCKEAERPGWCRFGCIMEVVAKVAGAVAAVIAVL